MKIGKKNDWALYSVLTLLFVVSVVYSLFIKRSRGELTIEVIQAGQVVMSSPLANLSGGENFEFRTSGGTNLISADLTGVRMISADCPGGDCLRMPEITGAGEMIVCMPHKLLVRLTAPQTSSLDAVSF
jgi:hypothetical protein